MHVKRSRLSSFDFRSVALFASLALGSGLAAAQSASPFTVGPGPGRPAAVAQPADASPATRTFKAADTDGDGSISRREAAHLGLDFDKLDRDKNGVISRPEYEGSVR